MEAVVEGSSPSPVANPNKIMKVYSTTRIYGNKAGEYGTEFRVIAANTPKQASKLAETDSKLNGDIAVTLLKGVTSDKTAPTILDQESHIE